jgi:heme/copper-type cytochrome/quinol oxidase subunit 2
MADIFYVVGVVMVISGLAFSLSVAGALGGGAEVSPSGSILLDLALAVFVVGIVLIAVDTYLRQKIAERSPKAKTAKFRRHERIVDCVTAVVLALAVILVGYYSVYVPTTTLDVTQGSWVAWNGTNLSQAWPGCGIGGGMCVHEAKLGSTWKEQMDLHLVRGSGEYNVTGLSVPSGFSVVSIQPALPQVIPPQGLPLNVTIKLPGSPGSYTFVGNFTLT